MQVEKILIRPDEQAIPTYVMPCFDLTEANYEQMNTMISQLVEPNGDGKQLH
jgi:hypothetical protein